MVALVERTGWQAVTRILFVNLVNDGAADERGAVMLWDIRYTPRPVSTTNLGAVLSDEYRGAWAAIGSFRNSGSAGGGGGVEGVAEGSGWGATEDAVSAGHLLAGLVRDPSDASGSSMVFHLFNSAVGRLDMSRLAWLYRICACEPRPRT